MTPTQESALFMHQLGHAVSDWAFLEMDLAILVAAAVSREDRHTLQVGFFAIENFRSKLACCDNILNERFHSVRGFEKWETVRAQIEALSRKRNRLAHQTVMVYPGGPVGRRIAILDWKANIHSSPKLAPTKSCGKVPPPGSLCVRDLAQVSLEFRAAQHAIRNMRAVLLGQPPDYPTALEQPPRVPTAASLFKAFKAKIVEK